jgi:ComF family protein
MARGNPVEQLFWGRCELERAASYSYYNRGTRIRKLIHNLKYKGISEIGTELGRIYGYILRDSGFLSDIDLIIPVPLHRSKEKLRGFNQSELIAEGLSASSGLPVGKRILLRCRETQTQTRRSRYERWINVEGIFELTAPEKIAGKHILLVDDVVTTGSTIESCVNELRKAGELRVSLVALAASVL